MNETRLLPFLNRPMSSMATATSRAPNASNPGRLIIIPYLSYAALACAQQRHVRGRTTSPCRFSPPSASSPLTAAMICDLDVSPEKSIALRLLTQVDPGHVSHCR